MEVPLLLQFSIALFTGMVAATFIPPVRRSIPRPFEALLWIGFVGVCVFGVISISDPNARELTTSALWGGDQMINSVAGLMVGGVLGWLVDNRFQIASWLVIVAGVDLFTIVLLRSRQAAQPWRPRIRLREWMEMPLQPVLVSAPATVPSGDPISELNRAISAGLAIAGTTMLTNVLDFSIWMRNVMLPRGSRRFASVARGSRIRSSAGLESLRDQVAHLRYAAWSWYAAAGQPALDGAVRQAMHASRVLQPVGKRASQVIDIRTLMSAQSTGWYGPLLAAPTAPGEGGNDESESERTDRLAS